MRPSALEDLPVAVIGAGPVGLAAAARLVERGLRPFVLERGPGAGAASATLPVEGETESGGRIAYGIPDVLGRDRADYAGQRVLMVGGGHSAINVALDLPRLQEEAPGTRVTRALRRDRIDRLLGGGLDDQLPERGALGLAAKRAIEDATGGAATNCCGGPAPAYVDACCAEDAVARASGGGCGSLAAAVPEREPACCRAAV